MREPERHPISWHNRKEKSPVLSPTFELGPSVTALLIVDMQYVDASPDYGFGKYLNQRWPKAASYYFQRLSRIVIPNHIRLLDFFRRNGLRVIYLTIGPLLGDKSDLAPFFRRAIEVPAKRPAYVSLFGNPGTKEFEILEELKPNHNELVLNKTSRGAFNSSCLETALRNMNIEFLIITGVATNVCVETTAIDAADRGFQCILVDDACGTYDPWLHKATMFNFSHVFGKVETTEKIISELSRLLQ